MPPNIDDFLGVTVKRLPGLTPSSCHGGRVKRAKWSALGGCTLHIAGVATAVKLPLEAEAGMLHAAECNLATDARSKLRWVLEDICVQHSGSAIASSDWAACLAASGEWVAGAPVAPRWLLRSLGASSSHAYVHSAVGSAYFVLGLLNFERTGYAAAHQRSHRLLYAFAACNVVTWLATWGVIFGTAGTSTFRILINGAIQVSWLYTLGRSIAAARRREFGEHRRWMLRNYATAFAIVLGRYVGTPLLVLGPGLSAWPSLKEFEVANITFGWLFTVIALELWLEFVRNGDHRGRKDTIHIEL